MKSELKTNWGKAALKIFGAIKNREDKSQDDDDSNLPFGLRSQMLSEPKALMYRALVASVASHAVVFPKVRLSDFLFVSGGGDDLRHAIKMDRKYVDFLLCDPFSMQPLLVIELGIPESEGKKRRTRDPFITRALKTSGIKLLKVEAKGSYPVRELRELLLPYIEQQRDVVQRPALASTSPAEHSDSSDECSASNEAVNDELRENAKNAS